MGFGAESVMCGFVYSAYNELRSKEYIGTTTLPTAVMRWNQHLHAADRGSALPLHCALRKYGVDVFRFSVIWEGPAAQLAEKEAQFILERNTLVLNGYNIRSGGEGLLLTEEARRLVTLQADKRSVDPLYVHPSLEFSGHVFQSCRKTGRVCVLLENEERDLIHFGVWPTCSHHWHMPRSKARLGAFKFFQRRRDGKELSLVVPLTAVSGSTTKMAMRLMPGNVFANQGRQRI